MDPLGLPPGIPIPAKPLLHILNVQMDNAVSDNKNKYVFCFWFVLVAKCNFCEVYVNFMLIGHTYDNIDALFGRWSMALRSFPTIPLLMKTSFMKNEIVPTIPHLIQEVPNFKKFIADWILDGEESLMGHTKVHQFKFYVDSTGTPVLKYKIYCHNENWLPKGEGNGIKLWKEDSKGRFSWPRGVPDAVKLEIMHHLPEVVKGLSGFIDHWEQSSKESIESRRLNELLFYYWRDVRYALSLPMDTPISLQNGFWPSIHIAHAVEDEFTEEGDVRGEYGEDDHFLGHRCDRLAPSFRIGCDLYVG